MKLQDIVENVLAEKTVANVISSFSF